MDQLIEGVQEWRSKAESTAIDSNKITKAELENDPKRSQLQQRLAELKGKWK
jgi:hypothetical protein